jgi:hypothetical protein
VSATEETKVTDSIHVGCGGMVLDSLDGPVCARCHTELRESDWLALDTPPPAATLDELRQYAERVSQASGMATVIVAHGGSHREFVVPSDSLGRHGDAAIDALVEAIRQRLEALSAEDSR